MTAWAIASAAVGLALPSAAAAAWLRRAGADLGGPAARAALALVLGLGGGSAVFAAWRGLGGGAGAAYVALDAAGFLAVAAAARPWRAAPPAGSDGPGPRLAAAFAAALATVATAAIVLRVVNHPDGDWDAWAMWNTRARFLFLAPPELAFWTQPTTHPDYPLLLPASVARLFAYAGGVTAAAPAAVAAAASVGLAALLPSALRDRPLAAAAAVALLVGAPAFVTLGASLYADVPLALAVLGSAVALDAGDAASGAARARAFAVAGAAAGVAAWTKNEGALWLVALAVARVALAPPGAATRLARSGVVPFLAGVAAPLAATMVYKASVAQPNEIVSTQGRRTLALLLDPERLAIVARGFARAAWTPGPGLAVVALAVAAVLGWRPWRGTAWPLASVALAAVGFGVVFLVTPHDLAWHLSHSIDRLVLQGWPLALYALFSRTPLPARTAAAEALAGTVRGG